MWHRSISVVIWAATSVGGALAAALPVTVPSGVKAVRAVEGIHEYQLSNGLQVLLIPDASKPTTTVNLTFRVGSRHENYGETGMAHLLEHLIFKGTPKYPQVWNEFTKRGLRANGSTWFDRTNYYASFADNRDNLSWYLGWLADATVNSFISRKDLDTEMTVVRNEMEMGENAPGNVLMERTLATMYQWHNYGKSTIGARADVENVDIGRLQAFYRTYYQPDNATLIVAGKFDVATTLARIQATFGALKKPQRVLPKGYTIDPVQDGERSVTVRRVGGTPMLFAAYHVPAGPHPDYAAVALLGQIMADAPSGRLHQALVETQLAAAVFEFNQALAEPGFALYGAQLAPDGDVDRARAALLKALESVAEQPITAQELQRAKTKWLNAWEAQFTNPEKVGEDLSESVAQGDWRLFFLLRDRVRDARLEDVQRVAQERLLPANRTLGQYVPTEKPQRAPTPAMVSLADNLATFKPAAAQAQAEAFDATPANIDARTQSEQVGGVKLALLPKPTRGQAVQAVLTLHVGQLSDLMNAGVKPVALAAVLDKGHAGLNRQQVQDELDALKTQLSFSMEGGVLTATLQSRQAHLPRALQLTAQLLKSASVPDDAVEEVRRQLLTYLEAQRKEPDALVQDHVARHGNPYPVGDPRHTPTMDALMADIQALKPDALRQWHRRLLGASHASLAVVGDFDPKAVREVVQAELAGWVSPTPYARLDQRPWQAAPQTVKLRTPDKQNANMLARLDMPLKDTDPDYVPLLLANHLFGAGGSSRLWLRIREKEGLSYDVRSTLDVSAQDAYAVWTASAIFAPQNQAKVDQAFREELTRAVTQGFTAQELAQAKQGLLSARRLVRAQDLALARGLGRNATLGRTMAFALSIDQAIEKVTLAQVNAAAAKYLKLDQLVVAYAGDFKE